MIWLLFVSVSCVLSAVIAPLVAALIRPGHDSREPSSRLG